MIICVAKILSIVPWILCDLLRASVEASSIVCLEFPPVSPSIGSQEEEAVE